MLQAEVRAAGEHGREIGVAVAVTVGHAAAEERHGVVEQSFSIGLRDGIERAKKAPELLGVESFDDREFLDVAGHLPMMGELMVALRDGKAAQVRADIGQLQRDDARRIRLQRQRHQIVVERDAIGEIHFIGSLRQSIADLRLRSVEPLG